MPRLEDGITLSDYTCEIIDYLQDCLDKLERGEEDMILGDPFYSRPVGREPFSDEDVARVVAAIDAEFATEMTGAAGYHRNRSGAETTPDFHRLGARAQRAMVEGLDAILARHAPVPVAAQSGTADWYD